MSGENTAKGLIIRGSNNVFLVRSSENGDIECKIKGKILKGVKGYYNPLAPGDIVEVEGSLITGLEKRRNEFCRFNQKGRAPQLLAANIDYVVAVCSVVSPPFRPRFLDRLLLQADAAGIPGVIVCNKYDLGGTLGGMGEAEERLVDYERIGIPVFRISVKTGEGISRFRDFTSGKFSVLTGQSGVGKSSLIMALIPNLDLKTGAVSEKFNRGKHITTQGILFEDPASGTRFVDTPGVRRFALTGIDAADLILYMSEFAPLAGKCAYGLSCSHENESGCKITEAVNEGKIHKDRYVSFIRIREDLKGNNFSE